MKYILMLFFIFSFSTGLVANEEVKRTYTKAEIKEMKSLKGQAYIVKRDIISINGKAYRENKKASSMEWHWRVTPRKGFGGERQKNEYRKKIPIVRKISAGHHSKALIVIRKYALLLSKYLKVKKATALEKRIARKAIKRMMETVEKNKFFYPPRIYDIKAYGTFERYFKEIHHNHSLYEEKRLARQKAEREAVEKKLAKKRLRNK